MSEGKVGMGTTGPGAVADIVGNLSGSTGALFRGASASELFRVQENGNVGIGTTGPASLLHLYRNTEASRNTVINSLTLESFSTSIGSPYTGNGIGILFKGIDYTAGTAYSQAQINSIMETHSPTTSTGLAFWTNPGTGLAEKVRINASGNVGIGEVAPGSKLSVSGGGSFGSGYDTTAAPTGGLIIEGNVGIGTTGPLTRLDIVGTAGAASYTNQMAFQWEGAGNGFRHWIQTFHSGTAANNKLAFFLNTGATAGASSAPGTGSLEVLTLTGSGNVGIGTTGPAFPLDVYYSGSNTPGLNVTDSANVPVIRLTRAGNAVANGIIEFAGNDNVADWSLKANLDGGGDNFNITEGATSRLYIKTGNVGIGTTGPGTKLEVYGTTQTPVIQLRWPNGLGVAGTVESAILFRSDDASAGSYLNPAAIKIIDTDTGGFGRYHRLGFFTASGVATEAERLSILNDGNVGIGTTGPSTLLHIQKDQNAATDISVKNDGTGTGAAARLTLASNSSSGVLGAFDDEYTGITEMQDKIGFYSSTSPAPTAIAIMARSAIPIEFYTGGEAAGNKRMVIDSTGNVGIGTTSPTAKLHLESAGSSDAIYFKGNTSASSPYVASYLQLESNTDIRGRGMLLTTTDAGASAAWFAGVPYNGGGFQIGLSDTHGRENAAGPYVKSNAKFYINTSGNVGIGTTGPDQILHLANAVTGATSGPVIRLERNDVGIDADEIYGGIEWEGQDASTNASGVRSAIRSIGEGSLGQTALTFYTSKANADGTLGERMRINSDGNVGIGTSTPLVKFAVHDGMASISFNSQDGTVLQLQDSDGTCTFNPESGGLTPSCSSDARLKHAIVAAPEQLSYLTGIPVRQYVVNASGETKIGTIAQELLTAGYGDLVSLGSDGYYQVAEVNPWQLVKGIQELDAKQASLSLSFEELVARVASLSAQFAPISAGSNVQIVSQSGLGDIFDRPLAWFSGVLRATSDIITEGAHKTYYSLTGLFD